MELLLKLLTKSKELLVTILATFITFIGPIQGILITIGLVILCDTIMAYWRVKKTDEKWSSRKLRKGLIGKFIPYQVSVILFYCIDINLLNEFTKSFIEIDFLFTKLLSLTLVFIEISSIDESWTMVKGSSIFDSFKSMIKKGKSLKKEIEEIKGQ